MNKAALLQKRLSLLLFLAFLLVTFTWFLLMTVPGRMLIGFFRGTQNIRVVLPTAKGLAVGARPRFVTDRPPLPPGGRITAIEPCPSGVEVSIRLPVGFSVPRYAEIRYEPDGSVTGVPLSIPVSLSAEITADTRSCPVTVVRRPRSDLLPPPPPWFPLCPSHTKNNIIRRRLNRRFNPSSPEGILAAATAAWKEGAPGRAAVLLQQLIASPPDSNTARKATFGLASCYLALYLPSRSLSLLETHPEAFSESDRAFLRALVFYQRGDYDALLDLTKNGSRASSSRLSMIRALALAKKNRFTESLRLLAKIREEDPMADYNTAVILEQLERFPETVILMRRLVSRFPDVSTFHYLLARNLEKLREFEIARQHYLEAARLETDPSLAAAYRKNARLLKQR
ncbi:MAG: hypothetical protein D6679_01180 [Candidatus Hydrogenedentota bacterium]|nr:MAG: hypothetical protein D6679_01180 [Candidatus Hydrogenedentota bacterium]